MTLFGHNPCFAQAPKERTTLKGHRDLINEGASVCRLAFSIDGMLLASASYDHNVSLWDVRTGQRKATLKGHAHWVECVSFSNDGTLLASASLDGTIKLWDAKTGQEKATLKDHDGGVFAVAFSPDSTILASGSKDQTVKLWDVKTAKVVDTLQGAAPFIALHSMPKARCWLSAAGIRRSGCGI